MKDETLKKLHQKELYLLNELDLICRKHNLKYYLIGGTLLGAVRHKGFIPWDDDLDIAMPREDFDQLMKIASLELSEDIYVQDKSTDEKWHNIHSKLRLRNTIFIEKKIENADFFQGIFIDIFPLDNGFDGKYKTSEFRNKMIQFIKDHIRVVNKEAKNNWKHRLAFIIPNKVYYAFCDNLIRKEGDCYVNYGSQYGIKKQTINKKYYDPLIEIEFEGIKYMAPRDYDYILRRIYGNNYMKLPPLEKRKTHDPVRLSFDTSGPDENLEG
ncbi:LicD family protein [Hungatella sp.]|jgi:lipopolysaccharide cholinephosphotransferase|uniref:LicD family protein n=1 Tax=Hungatella sp. TaxID=2613924 RepID=UPI002A7F8342|nr:LicD family protein [Hungatella sp.]